MKEFLFELDTFQLKNLFRSFRSKTSIISFWMHAIKTVLSYARPDRKDVLGLMAIRADKMRRVFVESQGKTFSASFPFSVTETEGDYTFHSDSGIEVDSKLSSEVISAIDTSLIFERSQVLDFADGLSDTSDDPDALWQLISDLICADDGYLRMDHDPDNENGDLHPLDHIDIFYSQSATFKVGLPSSIKLNQLTDILDLKSNCHFLGPR
ncbi:hypothetical protein JM93_03862 [Roseibium hamelinense]|uniref:Uncharacterized protein n=1 Tax=Roseibium hamelinense TaxID=150831 RepID=A0A562SMJ6_9HYPH|nr:hypothetical protein [Roseibium hamelinense]MTI43441.1 hypothetical protein [Roseibium hamelinense]TWI81900.1 hypothetical protein JM93_03862 [Roseibium hamelinense]